MERIVRGLLMDPGILSGPSPPRKNAAKHVSSSILMDAWPKNGLDAKMELCRWFMIYGYVNAIGMIVMKPSDKRSIICMGGMRDELFCMHAFMFSEMKYT